MSDLVPINVNDAFQFLADKQLLVANLTRLFLSEVVEAERTQHLVTIDADVIVVSDFVFVGLNEFDEVWVEAVIH